MPCVMIVDSSATIGILAARASATSGEKSKRSAALIAHCFRRGPRLAAADYRQCSFMDQWRGLAWAAHKKAQRLWQFALRRIRATLFAGSADKYESMDDKPDNIPVQPDLTASLRQARVENAERAEAV